MSERELLHGGVGNAGLVWREGDRLSRPAGPHVETIHALLRHLRASGFDGVPEPVGSDEGPREWLTFIPGDVPYPPFPSWSLTDGSLASVAVLLRHFHDATEGFDTPDGGSWNLEMSNGGTGDVICHNDVCLENVVFRNGTAVALLDFDFAAPGSPWWDLASFARMCVPMDAPQDAVHMGTGSVDPFARLRVVADAYGLPSDRSPLVDRLQDQIEAGGWFVRRRVEAGDQAFTRMWNESGGEQRYDRRREWFVRNREHLLDALHHQL